MVGDASMSKFLDSVRQTSFFFEHAEAIESTTDHRSIQGQTGDQHVLRLTIAQNLGGRAGVDLSPASAVIVIKLSERLHRLAV